MTQQRTRSFNLRGFLVSFIFHLYNRSPLLSGKKRSKSFKSPPHPAIKNAKNPSPLCAVWQKAIKIACFALVCLRRIPFPGWLWPSRMEGLKIGSGNPFLLQAVGIWKTCASTLHRAHHRPIIDHRDMVLKWQLDLRFFHTRISLPFLPGREGFPSNFFVHPSFGRATLFPPIGFF